MATLRKQRDTKGNVFWGKGIPSFMLKALQFLYGLFFCLDKGLQRFWIIRLKASHCLFWVRYLLKHLWQICLTLRFYLKYKGLLLSLLNRTEYTKKLVADGFMLGDRKEKKKVQDLLMPLTSLCTRIFGYHRAAHQKYVTFLEMQAGQKVAIWTLGKCRKSLLLFWFQHS